MRIKMFADMTQEERTARDRAWKECAATYDLKGFYPKFVGVLLKLKLPVDPFEAQLYLESAKA